MAGGTRGSRKKLTRLRACLVLMEVMEAAPAAVSAAPAPRKKEVSAHAAAPPLKLILAGACVAVSGLLLLVTRGGGGGGKSTKGGGAPSGTVRLTAGPPGCAVVLRRSLLGLLCARCWKLARGWASWR